ncbi:siderophore ABC transporter substrate-binding protein [Mammaliicoccus lentus]|uniref:siderophore ABC transporter substrate-binding protein n=1 Tax=Mammaliicoccus lentus TaxID=42858 RepID=UPI002B25FE40|nr:ABC transporter substrate-binding protein [Mammaliicoccus lentus]WQK49685.1 ABC transporter substrate-binding protein [Mammaliicoccus lentus]
MKKLIIFLALCLVLAACSQSNENKAQSNDKKENVKIKQKYELRGKYKDGRDAENKEEEVTVPKNPQKIVTFDYGAADIIKSLGKENSVAGISIGSSTSMLPEELKNFTDDKYKNVGELGKPNFEKIAEIDPDLIIFSNRTASSETLKEFKKAAPDAALVYIGSDDNNVVKSVNDNTKKLGKILDKEDKATELTNQLTNEETKAKNQAKKVDDSIMLLLVSQGELSTYGPGGRFGGLLYDQLGFKPADKDIKPNPHGQPVSFEYVSSKKPEVIFAMDRDEATDGKRTSEKVLSNDVLKNVPAVKDDNIINLDAKSWYFSSGGIKSTIKQIQEIQNIAKKLQE